MIKLPIGWNSLEERKNIEVHGVQFKVAAEVVKNSTSLRLNNLYSDFIFIGPTNDLSQVLLVSCKAEDGYRKIYAARKATKNEEDGYFNHLALRGLK